MAAGILFCLQVRETNDLARGGAEPDKRATRKKRGSNQEHRQEWLCTVKIRLGGRLRVVRASCVLVWGLEAGRGVVGRGLCPGGTRKSGVDECRCSRAAGEPPGKGNGIGWTWRCFWARPIPDPDCRPRTRNGDERMTLWCRDRGRMRLACRWRQRGEF